MVWLPGVRGRLKADCKRMRAERLTGYMARHGQLPRRTSMASRSASSIWIITTARRGAAPPSRNRSRRVAARTRCTARRSSRGGALRRSRRRSLCTGPSRAAPLSRHRTGVAVAADRQRQAPTERKSAPSSSRFHRCRIGPWSPSPRAPIAKGRGVPTRQSVFAARRRGALGPPRSEAAARPIARPCTGRA